MERILEMLKANQNRESTKHNYQSIWRQLNHFLVKLDHVPKDWEDRTSLFCTYLISRGIQSSTIRSYVSAIKNIIKTDNVPWDDSKILLSSIVRACKLKNDVQKTRLPIRIAFLELLLFELQREMGKQPYLCSLYQSMFAFAYYGLMRIGEIAMGYIEGKGRPYRIK